MRGLTGQDIREQGEGGAASVDGASEQQESERESEEESQAQKPDKATTSEHARQRNSVAHAQPSTASASSGQLKRNRVANNTGGSSNSVVTRRSMSDYHYSVSKNLMISLIFTISFEECNHLR